MRLILCTLAVLLPFYAATLWADQTKVVIDTPNSVESLHLDWLDKRIDLKQDFFGFANGGWQASHPIPDSYARWTTFHLLQEKNYQAIKALVESAAAQPSGSASAIEQKVGDFYFSGMDEASINEAGIKPLQADLDFINQIKNTTDLRKAIVRCHFLGVDALFHFTEMQDYQDSQKVIGVVFQGGLSLPDRDYYLKNEADFQKIRQAYLAHIASMLMLLGDSPEKAATEANTVMAIETDLAKASMSKIDQRDSYKIYHLKKVTELKKLAPNFAWRKYFAEMGRGDLSSVNVAMPEFFKQISVQLKTVSLEDWKIYLRWHLISAYASYLSQPFVDEHFKMTQLLTGAKTLLPRWQRVVMTEDEALGFAVGQLYVDKFFPAASKKQVQEIFDHIRLTLEGRLKALDWMSPETREAALLKLSLMGESIGYPDKWLDYTKLKIDRSSYALNVMRANEFYKKRELNKIGKPVDKDEWDMTPQTVNAYYNPSLNKLVIPAGLLQAPFFDPQAPLAVNYGAIGSIMGHEMLHGFDDQGSQFDGKGNLKNWWTTEDLKKFKQKTQATIDQFSQYTVDGGTHVQGELVVGEAAADLGGLTVAYNAFLTLNAEQQAPAIEGFTPDQQFFLGAAHIWASNIRPEEARRLATIDPHPPAVNRVDGTLADMPAFQQAFNIPVGSPMANKPCCAIW